MLNQYSAGINLSCSKTQHSADSELNPTTPRSRVKPSTTVLLSYLILLVTMHNTMYNQSIIILRDVFYFTKVHVSRNTVLDSPHFQLAGFQLLASI